MRLSRRFKIAMISFLLISASGCKKAASAPTTDKPSDVKVEPHVQDDELPTVMFDIKIASDSPGTPGSRIYDCTYQARGKTAKFQLQFRQKGPMSGEFPMASADGRFLAVAGSDNSVLLEELKKALDAKRVPKKYSRIVDLPFDAVILGERQSRSPSGGYASDPPGDWTAIKIFLPKGADDKGEVFLNLNPVLGKAEFSIKDSDYGDYLLAQFARVL